MVKNKIVVSRRLIALSCAVLFLLLILFNASYLLSTPPVWPDEALFADSALNILHEGRNGTDLLKGTLPGSETFGFGYPPIYFYTTAAWIKVFGFSIYTQRLLSLGLGTLFSVLFLLMAIKLLNKQVLKKTAPLLVLLTTWLLLLTDPAFTKAIHIARPEIEVLVLGFASLLFYLKSQDKKNPAMLNTLSSLFLSLAFLTHYLAVIFLLGIFLHSLILNPKSNLFTKKNILFLISFSVPIFIWLLLISKDIHYLLDDITLRLRYKTTSPYWIWIVFSSSSLITKLQYIFYFIVTWEIALNSLLSKNKNSILVTILLILSWVWTYLWQTEYSFIYTVIFVYLGLIYLISTNFDLKENAAQLKFKVLFIITLFLISSNIWNQLTSAQNFSGGNFDYNLYTDKILGLIPDDNSTVYLSAIPDPYYGFKGYRNNKLYEYPGLPTNKNNLLRVLDETDYIIFNSPLESIVVGNVVTPYIQANAINISPVGGANQYQAFVIKLKPRSSRIH